MPSAETIWEIGSITKLFTGLLLAIAAVSGEVSLKTPVRELLPEPSAVPNREGVEITLEHLATHRSGLPRSPVGIPADVWAVLIKRANPYADISDQRLLEILARTELQIASSRRQRRRSVKGSLRVAYAQ